MSTVAQVEWGLNVSDKKGETHPNIREGQLAIAHDTGCLVWASLSRIHGIPYTKVTAYLNQIVDGDWVHVQSTLDDYEFVAKNLRTGEIRDFAKTNATKAAALAVIDKVEDVSSRVQERTAQRQATASAWKMRVYIIAVVFCVGMFIAAVTALIAVRTELTTVKTELATVKTMVETLVRAKTNDGMVCTDLALAK